MYFDSLPVIVLPWPLDTACMSLPVTEEKFTPTKNKVEHESSWYI